MNEKPTEILLNDLCKSEEDVKNGRVISFKSGKEALAWLDKKISQDNRRFCRSDNNLDSSCNYFCFYRGIHNTTHILVLSLNNNKNQNI